MGIKGLNYCIKKNCNKILINKQLKDLKGKRIVIDISIYLYQFLMTNNYIEHIFIMITKCIKYDITPIFVFDGGIPTEKKALIEIRKQKKNKCKEEYEKLYEKYNELIHNNNEIDQNKIIKMKRLLKLKKKNCIKIKKTHIINIQNLFDACGIQYITADGEADVLCSKIVKDGNAYACLSEDTDMFVYGCPIVLRYFSLFNETFIEYNLTNILKCMNMDFQSFQDICILSGTDYNDSIYKIDVLYDIYINEYLMDKINNSKFYNWFKTKYYINDISHIYNLFDITNVQYIIPKSSNMNINYLKNILLPYNFIFI